MTSVSVYSHTHSVVYVADNILKGLKDIIRRSGLDPANFVRGWESNLRAIRTWIESGHLVKVFLEIYDPDSNQLIYRWDLDIVYGWSEAEGSFWADTDQLEYHIRKAGRSPQEAKYELLLETTPGRPDVEGWSTGTARSLNGFVRQSLGTTIENRGLGANASYWRRG